MRDRNRDASGLRTRILLISNKVIRSKKRTISPLDQILQTLMLTGMIISAT